MKVIVLNQSGEKVKDLALSPIFEAKISDSALALYLDYLRNSMRDAISNSKDRSEVSGTGKKPYKQKGTGNARQGSRRAPHFVGGGVAFGPTSERNYTTRINKSLKRKAIIAILGEALSKEKGIVIDSLKIEDPKTKSAALILENVKASGKISVIISNSDENAVQSFRNIRGVKLSMPGKLDIVSIMSSDKVLISEESLKELEVLHTK